MFCAGRNCNDFDQSDFLYSVCRAECTGIITVKLKIKDPGGGTSKAVCRFLLKKCLSDCGNVTKISEKPQMRMV